MIVFSPTMANRMKELAGFIRKVRTEKRLSTTDVQTRSHGGVSDATITKIENDKAKSVSLDIVEAIAKGLEVPLVEVLEAFYGRSLYKEKDELNLDDLNREQKELVRQTVKHMVSGMQTEPEIKGRLEPQEVTIATGELAKAKERNAKNIKKSA